jgi:hypothetical protein
MARAARRGLKGMSAHPPQPAPPKIDHWNLKGLMYVQMHKAAGRTPSDAAAHIYIYIYICARSASPAFSGAPARSWRRSEPALCAPGPGGGGRSSAAGACRRPPARRLPRARACPSPSGASSSRCGPRARCARRRPTRRRPRSATQAAAVSACLCRG